MELWLRILGHLLPRGWAFGLWVERKFALWWSGIALWLAGLRGDLDQVWTEIFPATTTRLADHEEQFGASLGPSSDAERRAALHARWLMLRGGQGPDYIQEILQLAGFPVWLHEFWDPDTFAVRDPRPLVTSAHIGRVQCGNQIAYCGHALAQCSHDEVAGANYLVNKTLTSEPRPPIPDAPEEWEGIVYVGGETFPAHAEIPAARRDEFEDLLLQLVPQEKWIVLLVDYVGGTSIITDDDGAPLLTDDGEAFLV